MTTNNHPQYSKIIVGDNAISLPLVCKDGAIRMCRTEQYADGFVAFVTNDGSDWTNHARYATARKARNAAAKWFA